MFATAEGSWNNAALAFQSYGSVGCWDDAGVSNNIPDAAALWLAKSNSMALMGTDESQNDGDPLTGADMG